MIKTTNSKKLRHLNTLKRSIKCHRYMDSSMKNSILEHITSLEDKYTFYLRHYGEDVDVDLYNRDGKYIGGEEFLHLIV